MKKNLISIILTLYNKRPFIEETIFSIYNQTYTNRELIIVDDCSTDESFEIAKSFCKKLWIIEKCKFVQNEKNLWVAKTFERWLQEATWEYIAMCDWDDILIKDKLEKNISFCNQWNYDFIYSYCIPIDDNNNVIWKPIILNFKWYKKSFRFWVAIGSSIFFSSKHLTQLLSIGFPYNIAQDFFVEIFSCFNNHRIWEQKEVLYYYRKSALSISNRVDWSLKSYIRWRRDKVYAAKYLLEKKIYYNLEMKKFLENEVDCNKIVVNYLEWKTNVFSAASKIIKNWYLYWIFYLWNWFVHKYLK